MTGAYLMKDGEKQNSHRARTVCATHCGGACLLNVHVGDGRIIHVETDTGPEPQLRACARGRALRQRVYSSDRLLHPLKRIGDRGEGKFRRITWDEALDTVATRLKQTQEAFGPKSILYLHAPGDQVCLNNPATMNRLLALAGGFTARTGTPSFQAGMFASFMNYGSLFCSNTGDDLVHSRLIIMWGWDPAGTMTGTNTPYFPAKAKEAGARIVAVDPYFSDSAAVFAHEWIPIRPGTDTAMLAAMAQVIVSEGLQDQHFLDTYTVGFDQFREYVLGTEDGIPKTPVWAEAITLATMTGNVGIHGGDAAARAWESTQGGYPFGMGLGSAVPKAVNPVEKSRPGAIKIPGGEQYPHVHLTKVADAILQGKQGGYPADYKLLFIVSSNYLNSTPNTNKIISVLKTIDFIVVAEQYLTATARYADIILPTASFVERDDITLGVSLGHLGFQRKIIEPLGECRAQNEIAKELAARIGIPDYDTRTGEEPLRDVARRFGTPDYEAFKESGVHWIARKEPYVAFQKQIEYPDRHPFPTPSGKIEIYSRRIAEMNNPLLPPIPRYIETWEGINDPLAATYPLQLVTKHAKRRANAQFDTIPRLKELIPQAVVVNGGDARQRDIREGDQVRVFNDRGAMIIPATVTERLMPGVAILPAGAWYAPDEQGIDRGGCANILTRDEPSPGGAFPFNTALVQIEKA